MKLLSKLLRRRREAEEAREALLALINKHTNDGKCVMVSSASTGMMLVVCPGKMTASKALEDAAKIVEQEGF